MDSCAGSPPARAATPVRLPRWLFYPRPVTHRPLSTDAAADLDTYMCPKCEYEAALKAGNVLPSHARPASDPTKKRKATNPVQGARDGLFGPKGKSAHLRKLTGKALFPACYGAKHSRALQCASRAHCPTPPLRGAAAAGRLLDARACSALRKKRSNFIIIGGCPRNSHRRKHDAVLRPFRLPWRCGDG